MRYFVGFLITVGLLFLLVILLLTNAGKPAKITPKTLDSYASTDAVTSLTTDGPINAESLHQQIRISVDRDTVTYEQTQGYNGSVVNTQTFANNQNAYSAFLHALAHSGFTRGDTSKALSNETGVCPLGSRYIFQLDQGDKTIQRFWATSCGNPKTYKGNLNTTLRLFQVQVPGYSDLVNNLDI
ncbi:MAG TPA: hypothetical protein VK534_01570 [Methylomirabilota bacterium]|nr:hypothetical protein [Methylomirabilota bacterium]